MFNITDRYIVKEILAPFFLGLLVFTFILMMPPIMEVAEGLIAKGVDWITIVQLMVTLLPQGLGVTIPMALLIGILVGLGRLSGDRETVAMQACGMSLLRLLRPIALLSLLATAVTCYILVVVLPYANQTFREITYRTITTRAQDQVQPRVFYEDFPGIVLYARDITSDGSWSQIFLADTRQPDQPTVYIARAGRMRLDRDQQLVDVVLEDGSGHRVNPWEPDQYEVQQFEEIRIGLNPETVFPRSGPQRGYPELTVPELQAEVEQLEAQGLSPHRAIIEIHRKFSIPIACLVFGLLGLVLGVSNRRDGRLASFALGIGVIFTYYVIMYTSEAMAKATVLSPHLAMWIPNVMLGLIGSALLFRRLRSRKTLLRMPTLFSSATHSRQKDNVQRAANRSQSLPQTGAALGGLRSWGLNVLDWYVVRVYLKIIGLAFVGLLGIFYISTFIDLSDKLFKGDTTGRELLSYLWFATPQYIYYIIPISALVATLVTVGLLTKSSELTVMKACGISLYRVVTPLLLFGILWSGILFMLDDAILAQSNRQAESIRHVIRGGSPQTFDVLNRKWIVGRSGSIYNYVYMDPSNDELSGLSIYEFDGWDLSRRSFARNAVFQDTWNANDVWIRNFNPESAEESFSTLPTQALELEPPEYFETERPDAERMNYRQLHQYIGELRTSGFNVIQLAVALHRKLAFPPITVIMTLIAIPFAVVTGRRGAMYGVGIGISLAIIYWTVISIFAAIGSGGLMAPVLAAWAPNILFGSVAACLLFTVRT